MSKTYSVSSNLDTRITTGSGGFVNNDNVVTLYADGVPEGHIIVSREMAILVDWINRSIGSQVENAKQKPL